MSASSGHALILGSRGVGWTSIEALDPATGLTLWAYEPHRELTTVVCADGVVFAAMCVWHRTDRNQPASVVALRARDGTQLWWTDAAHVEPRLRWTRLQVGLRVAFGQFSPVGAWQAMRSMRLSGGSYSMPLATDGSVLCVCSGPLLLGFGAASGRLRWVAPALNGQARHVFAVRNGRVLVTGNRDYATGGPGLEALDAHTGRVLWRYQNTFAPPRFALDDEHVYALANLARPRASGKLAIVTLSIADGTQQCWFALHPPDSYETMQLISEEGVAYLLRDRSLCAIRLADERELWRTPPFKGMTAELAWLRLAMSPTPATMPTAPRRLTFAYTQSSGQLRTLYAGTLDADSGALLWQWEEAGGPQPSGGVGDVAVVQGAVFLRAAGATYAFSAADGRLLWRVPAGFSPVSGPALVALDS
jgi:outer membrane protein assembly factor BamB